MNTAINTSVKAINMNREFLNRLNDDTFKRAVGISSCDKHGVIRMEVAGYDEKVEIVGIVEHEAHGQMFLFDNDSHWGVAYPQGVDTGWAIMKQSETDSIDMDVRLYNDDCLLNGDKLKLTYIARPVGF